MYLRLRVKTIDFTRTNESFRFIDNSVNLFLHKFINVYNDCKQPQKDTQYKFNKRLEKVPLPKQITFN